MGWPDKYTKKAHAQGYAARSVYKLEELDQAHGLLKKDMRVLDLGCFPGSFCQYAAKKVGTGGAVVGVDVQRMRRFAGVRFIEGDVFADATLERLRPLAPFDIVFSDMAPQTTGNRKLDQNRSADLVSRAWQIACTVGKPGAVFVVKYFQGSAEQVIKSWGVSVKTIKPRASRKESYEMFAYCTVPETIR